MKDVTKPMRAVGLMGSLLPVSVHAGSRQIGAGWLLILGMGVFANGCAHPGANGGVAGVLDAPQVRSATNQVSNVPDGKDVVTTTVVLDATIAKKIRDRTNVGPDPFGNAGQVVVAEQAHHDEQKICLVTDEGMFVVPGNPTNQFIVFRLAVQGPLGVRIVFSTSKGSVSHRATLAEENKWCDVVVPLAALADRLGRGEKVNDITILQKDISHKGMMYMQSAVLAVAAEASAAQR